MLPRRLVLLGHLWALPITLFGGLVAAIGGRPHSWTREGILKVVVRSKGPLRWYFKRFRISGLTLGAVVLFAEEAGPLDEELCAHERAHVLQTFVLGPLMAPAYFGASAVAWLRGGKLYEDNWFERAARKAAYRGLRAVR